MNSKAEELDAFKKRYLEEVEALEDKCLDELKAIEVRLFKEIVSNEAKYQDMYHTLYSKEYKTVNRDMVFEEAHEEQLKGIASLCLTLLKNNTVTAKEVEELQVYVEQHYSIGSKFCDKAIRTDEVEMVKMRSAFDEEAKKHSEAMEDLKGEINSLKRKLKVAIDAKIKANNRADEANDEVQKLLDHMVAMKLWFDSKADKEAKKQSKSMEDLKGKINSLKLELKVAKDAKIKADVATKTAETQANDEVIKLSAEICKMKSNAKEEEKYNDTLMEKLNEKIKSLIKEKREANDRVVRFESIAEEKAKKHRESMEDLKLEITSLKGKVEVSNDRADEATKTQANLSDQIVEMRRSFELIAAEEAKKVMEINSLKREIMVANKEKDEAINFANNEATNLKNQSTKIVELEQEISSLSEELLKAKTEAVGPKLLTQSVPVLLLEKELHPNNLRMFHNLETRRIQLQGKLQSLGKDSDSLINNMWAKIGVFGGLYVGIISYILVYIKLSCWESLVIGVGISFLFLMWLCSSIHVAKVRNDELKTNVGDYVVNLEIFQGDVQRLHDSETDNRPKPPSNDWKLVEKRVSALNMPNFNSRRFVRVCTCSINITLWTFLVLVVFLFFGIGFRFCSYTEISGLCKQVSGWFEHVSGWMDVLFTSVVNWFKEGHWTQEAL